MRKFHPVRFGLIVVAAVCLGRGERVSAGEVSAFPGNPIFSYTFQCLQPGLGTGELDSTSETPVFKVEVTGTNGSDSATQLTGVLPSPVKAGETLRVRFKFRSVGEANAVSNLVLYVQESQEPYEGFANIPLAASTEWEEVDEKIQIPKDFSVNGLMANIFFGRQSQKVEIKDMEVTILPAS